MAFTGYDIGKVLENTLPDPNVSVRRTMYAGIINAVGMIGVSLVWPYFPIYFYSCAAISLVISAIMWRILREAQRDEDELVKDRKFSIDDYPVHEEDQADLAHDRALNFQESPGRPLRGKYWFMPGCPHEKVIVDETVTAADGTVRKRKMYRRRLVERWRGDMLAIRQHLITHHPAVYETVGTWWELHVRDKVLHQRFPGRTFASLNKDARAAILDVCQVEFLEGCCIALRPETWNRKYDRRPSHRHTSELRLLLTKRFVIDGDYPNQAALAQVPWIRLQKKKWIYIGHGSEWLGRHAQKYYYEKFRDPDLIKTSQRIDPAKRDGDTRPYGIIWRTVRPIFVSYESLKEHTVILGGSGKGKSRCNESPMIASIVNGGRLAVIDPKIDERSAALCAHYCCLVGREEDFQWLNLALPENPYNCSLNPLFGVLDPREFGSRMGAMFPPNAGENQFFVDEAKRVSRNVLTVCYWINEYLALLSGGDVAAQRPPKLLLWLSYCQQNGIDGTAGADKIAAARVAFMKIYERMWEAGSAFHPVGDLETTLAEMWNCEQYRAEHWLPNYNQVLRFAAQRPWRLISWGVRLVHWHVLADHPDWNAVDWPERDDRETVIEPTLQPPKGEKPPVTLLKFFNGANIHPLDPRAEGSNREYILRWKPLYEAMIPREQVPVLRRIMREFSSAFDEQMSNATQDLETYKKHTGQLDSPVSLVTTGGNGRILTTPNPDITMERLHRENKVIFIGAGVMVDRDTALNVCKTFTQAILTYGGMINAKGGKDLDLTVVAEEMASWVTKDWSEVIDKLRATGVRTLNNSQSMAGMRAQVGNADFVQHMYANFNTKIQFCSQSKEDAEFFVEGVGTCQFFKPQRSVNENPGFGKTGVLGEGAFNVGETWTLNPEELKIVDPDTLGRLPKLQAFVTQPDKLWLVQVPIIAQPPIGYMAQIGCDQERNPCEIEGIDFDKRAEFALDENWGSNERLNQAKQSLATKVVTAEEIDRVPVKLMPNAPGFVTMNDVARIMPRERTDTVKPDAAPAAPPPRSKEVETSSFNDMIAKIRAGSAAKPTPAVAAPEPRRRGGYLLPPASLLRADQLAAPGDDAGDAKRTSDALKKAFGQLGIEVKVVGTQSGPVLTQYEIALTDTSVRLSKVENLDKDLSLKLGCDGIRIVAPLPNRTTIGIEVPNKVTRTVGLQSLLDAAYQNDDGIPLIFGRDVVGRPLIADLTKMPHLLVAGATGMGKSVCLNALISSILLTRSPDEVKLLMIDPKMVELSGYDGIPHLLNEPITEPVKAYNALVWAMRLMDERYEVLRLTGVRDIRSYNALSKAKVEQRLIEKGSRAADVCTDGDKMPYLVIVIDEYADLMLMIKEVERVIVRLAAKSRACGIHLVITTQRPSADVVTGLIKSNLPSRVCFRVADKVNSRVVLDVAGAENLLGRGDLLLLEPGAATPVRGQGAWVQDAEISAIVAHTKAQASPTYDPDISYVPPAPEDEAGSVMPTAKWTSDRGFHEAVAAVLRHKRSGADFLRRRLGIGYNKATSYVDTMEAIGIIGPSRGTQAREILKTFAEWRALLSDNGVTVDESLECYSGE